MSSERKGWIIFGLSGVLFALGAAQATIDHNFWLSPVNLGAAMGIMFVITGVAIAHQY